MNQCNSTLDTAYQPSISAKLFKTAPEMKNEACQHIVFVHDLKGNDLFDGALERPLKTIQSARSLTRSLRSVHGADNTLCITIRGGTYYSFSFSFCFFYVCMMFFFVFCLVGITSSFLNTFDTVQVLSPSADWV
jgi:hypothetical protein